MALNISHISVKKDNGEEKLLGEYKGQVLLIVNVASYCGFTKQYQSLQALQEKYGNQGFLILAFPCNDFGQQEPGTIEEIKSFCTSNYKVTFPIFEKVHATGTTTEPYGTLIKSKPPGPVEWNFEKFLISKEGDILARFKSGVEPDSNEITTAIEEALKN